MKISPLSFANQKKVINSTQNEQITFETPIKATAHAPIIINGSTKLAAFTDKTGSGTLSDPYIIQNLEISTEGIFGSIYGCLILNNISSYLVIRNIIIENLLINSNPLRFIYVGACNNIRLDSIILRNSNCSNTGTSYVFYLTGSDNCTFSNIQMHNVSIYKGYRFILNGCENIIIENFEDLDGKFQASSTEFYTMASHDVIIQNGKISNNRILAADFYLFFQIFSNNVQIINLTFERNYISGTLVIISYQGLNHQNVTIDNLIIRDIQANNIGGGFLDANVTIRNCQFINLFSDSKMELLNVLDCLLRIESNLMQNLSTNNANITAIVLDSSVVNSLIFDNEFRMFDPGIASSSCLQIGSGSIGHQIYYNRFMTGTDLVVDNAGGNQYTGLIYFPPVHMEMYIGNYWIDHHLDESSDLHYIVTSPKSIAGNGNSIDPLPLHYFGMDFDHDTLLNYYEDQYGFDIWDPDTDHDGVLDPDEILSNPSSFPSGWNLSIFNDPPTVFLGLIALFLLLNLVIRPRQTKNKSK